MNIFVGNLSFDASEEDVRKLFGGFGNVSSVAIVMSKGKRIPRSRGFGFVEMPDEQEALAAITALSGKEFMGRPLNISPSRSKEAAPQDARINPPPRRRDGYSGYKEGRRSRSFLKRRSAAGITEPLPERKKAFSNPMRWKKKARYSKRLPR